MTQYGSFNNRSVSKASAQAPTTPSQFRPAPSPAPKPQLNSRNIGNSPYD